MKAAIQRGHFFPLPIKSRKAGLIIWTSNLDFKVLKTTTKKNLLKADAVICLPTNEKLLPLQLSVNAELKLFLYCLYRSTVPVFNFHFRAVMHIHSVMKKRLKTRSRNKPTLLNQVYLKNLKSSARKITQIKLNVNIS